MKSPRPLFKNIFWTWVWVFLWVYGISWFKHKWILFVPTKEFIELDSRIWVYGSIGLSIIIALLFAATSGYLRKISRSPYTPINQILFALLTVILTKVFVHWFKMETIEVVCFLLIIPLIVWFFISKIYCKKFQFNKQNRHSPTAIDFTKPPEGVVDYFDFKKACDRKAEKIKQDLEAEQILVYSIDGDFGSGKSSYARTLVSQLMKKYNEGEELFYTYISLTETSTVKDFDRLFQERWVETLKERYLIADFGQFIPVLQSIFHDEKLKWLDSLLKFFPRQKTYGIEGGLCFNEVSRMFFHIPHLKEKVWVFVIDEIERAEISEVFHFIETIERFKYLLKSQDFPVKIVFVCVASNEQLLKTLDKYLDRNQKAFLAKGFLIDDHTKFFTCQLDKPIMNIEGKIAYCKQKISGKFSDILKKDEDVNVLSEVLAKNSLRIINHIFASAEGILNVKKESFLEKDILCLEILKGTYKWMWDYIKRVMLEDSSSKKNLYKFKIHLSMGMSFQGNYDKLYEEIFPEKSSDDSIKDKLDFENAMVDIEKLVYISLKCFTVKVGLYQYSWENVLKIGLKEWSLDTSYAEHKLKEYFTGKEERKEDDYQYMQAIREMKHQKKIDALKELDIKLMVRVFIESFALGGSIEQAEMYLFDELKSSVLDLIIARISTLEEFLTFILNRTDSDRLFSSFSQEQKEVLLKKLILFIEDANLKESLAYRLGVLKKMKERYSHHDLDQLEIKLYLEVPVPDKILIELKEMKAKRDDAVFFMLKGVETQQPKYIYEILKQVEKDLNNGLNKDRTIIVCFFQGDNYSLFDLGRFIFTISQNISTEYSKLVDVILGKIYDVTKSMPSRKKIKELIDIWSLLPEDYKRARGIKK